MHLLKRGINFFFKQIRSFTSSFKFFIFFRIFPPGNMDSLFGFFYTVELILYVRVSISLPTPVFPSKPKQLRRSDRQFRLLPPFSDFSLSQNYPLSNSFGNSKTENRSLQLRCFFARQIFRGCLRFFYSWFVYYFRAPPARVCLFTLSNIFTT